MTIVNIDITGVASSIGPLDKVIFYAPEVRARVGGGLVSTREETIPLVDGKASVTMEPGPVYVRFQVQGIADTKEKFGIVPDFGEVSLDDVLQLKFTWTPPLVNAALQQIIDQMNYSVDQINGMIDDELGSVVRSAEAAAVSASQSAAQAEVRATSSEIKVDAYTPRVEALEAMNGVSPESPVDGQTASLIGQDDTLTRKAVLESVSSETAVVSVSRFGATGDGDTDDTASIQSAIDWVASRGGGTVLVPDGTYMIKAHVVNGTPNTLQDQGGIAMRDGVHLRLSTNAVLQAITNGERNYIIVRFYDVRNASISGGTIRGERHTHASTIGEWGHGICLTGGRNIVIEDILIEDCWGDGIYTQEIAPPVPTPEGHVGDVPQGVYLTRVTCSGNRRQGMSIVGVIDLVATDCVFKDTEGTSPEAGVDIEPLAIRRPTEKMRFIRCKFINNAGNGIVAVNDSTRDLEVIDCEFSGNRSPEAQVKTSLTSRGYRFERNVVSGTSTTASAMYFRGGGDYAIIDNHVDNRIAVTSRDGQVVTDVVISGNHVEYLGGGSGRVGLDVMDAKNVMVSDNKVHMPAPSNVGIRIWGGEDVTIRGNRIHEGHTSITIGRYDSVKGCKNVSITNNHITDTYATSMMITAVDGLIFSENRMEGVGHEGIDAAFFNIAGESSGVRVYRNTFIQAPLEATGTGRAILVVRLREHGLDTVVSGNRIVPEPGKSLPLWEPLLAFVTTGYLGNESGLMVTPTSARPSEPEIGTQVWDTTLSRMVVWDGVTWVELAVTGHPDPDPVPE